MRCQVVIDRFHVRGCRSLAVQLGEEGFTIIELMVSTAILGLIMLVTVSMVQGTNKVWQSSTTKIETFRNARNAFETVTNLLSQATLNTYSDYYNALGQTAAQFYNLNPAGVTFLPAAFGRQSDLHFISGTASTLFTKAGFDYPNGAVPSTHAVFFQAPLGYTTNGAYSGLNSMMNAVGFYVVFDSNANTMNAPPAIFPNSTLYRYRLMEWIQPSEDFYVYQTFGTTNNVKAAAAVNEYTWFTGLPTTTCTLNEPATCTRILANNIIALVIAPQSAPGTYIPNTDGSYVYDSRDAAGWVPASPGIAPVPQPPNLNQVPPLVQVTMVAIDEPSAKLMQLGAPDTPPGVITTALANGPFNDCDAAGTDYQKDLNALEATLNDASPKINYRIFSTTVAIRSAQFSQ